MQVEINANNLILNIKKKFIFRCGSSFCSEHRYPEAHACAYDYKAEGKRLIERNNPLVTAPKLPKI